MKFTENALFCLAREGRLTLQIPDVEINFGGGPTTITTEVEVDPDHIDLCYGNKLTPRGYPHFSLKGYEFYKDRLKAAFVDTGRGNWGAFEEAAEEHFAALEANLKKDIAKAAKKLAALRALAVSKGLDPA